MNFPNNTPYGRSPIQREHQLQGPRPTPLRINKNSHKIKKPPLAPQAQPRLPVIIYMVSPKIIHTTPNEFMSLVQRLTGSSSSSTSSNNASMSNDSLRDNTSYEMTTFVAAPCTTIEKARGPNQEIKKQHQSSNCGEERKCLFNGVYSPSSLFLDPDMISFINDLSPVLSSDRNFMKNSFTMPNPSNFVSPPPQSIDLFNNF